ncbi:MAG TPA: hypothetical protein VND62_10785 [Acidimicrobiales bacterium]|nr:hypothetical protein [Acidimicrobiales bacterium]
MAAVTGGVATDFDGVVAALARALAQGGEVTTDVHRRAATLAEAAGIRTLTDSLALAERILRAGEGFHAIERFFVDGSDEQRYLIELHRRT